MALFNEAEIISLGLSDYSTIELLGLEDDIYQITHNDFAVSEWDTTGITSSVITVEEGHNIVIGDYVRIYIDDTMAYSEVYTVTAVSSTTVTISETVLDTELEGTIVKIKYPNGIKALAVRYLKSQVSSSGISSETVGRYSVTYDKSALKLEIKEKYGKYYKRSD